MQICDQYPVIIQVGDLHAPDLSEIEHETCDVFGSSFQPRLCFSDLNKGRTDKCIETWGRFVFLCEPVIQSPVTQGTEEKLRETKFLAPAGPGGRRQVYKEPHRKDTRVVRRQETPLRIPRDQQCREGRTG